MNVDFKGDRVISNTNDDQSLLELALENGIPHIHECYGSARCSTCRVRVLEGAANLSAPSEAEKRIAALKGWPENIRLACQARPSGDVVVKRLVLDEEDIQLAWSEVSRLRSGVEKEIVVFFLDVAKFTSFTERNLPYDVIHIMNRFFNRLGDIVLANQGYIDKFIGDSIMALFGIEDQSIDAACLDALVAASAMNRELESFNVYLREQFDHEFDIRIGISAGPVILGSLGHRDNAHYTAIGDAVNTASRLEHANKKVQSRVLITDRIYQLTRDQIQIGRTFHARLRGISHAQPIYEFLDVNNELRSARMKSAETGSVENPAARRAALTRDLPVNLPAWETDNDHTEIGFEIDYLTTSVRGIFRAHLVDIRYDETRPQETALNAIIKTSSIDTFVSARDNHLRSADFFDCEFFPDMTFRSSGVTTVSNDEFVLKGDLTIRDTSRSVELQVRRFPALADAWGVYKQGIIAETEIDRYDFGISFNLPLQADRLAIGRTVRIKLILQITPAAPAAD
ncbi:MAG: YceI family protein [Leptospiraceae bacterium]|nr:YceI family protein [Leptospiraceae bacterium]